MIAVDTSALLAIVLDEEHSEKCSQVLRSQARVLISAGTLAEALLVASRRSADALLSRLVAGLRLEVMPVTQAVAIRVAEAHTRWGRGVHPAGLNFGDCFAYEVAATHECPLLFIGNDFSRTDLTSVLAPT